MKIKDSVHTGSVLPRGYAATSTPVAGEGSKDSLAKNTDKVSIGAAKALSETVAPDLFGANRAEKVAMLKSLVQSGKYKPDTTKVAEEFIKRANEDVDLLRSLIGEDE